MDELEYLFKHALTQEAAYESLLLSKRKELHYKVAQAIEIAFKEKISKFYGMLAYHYSMGDEYEKAEEYMIKAGEEALRSSASSEALNYYLQALDLYIKNHGKNVDQEKLGMFEKNIALAYHNKGLYTQGIEHFDKALKYLGDKSPKSNIIKYIIALIGLGRFIKEINFKSKKQKDLPSEKERERIDLHILLLSELGNVNPNRFLIDGFIFIKTLLKYDVRQLDNGVRVFLLGSIIITVTGFFKLLSRKMIDFSGRYVNAKDVISFVGYPLCRIQFNLIHGDWDTEYDEEILFRGLRAGEIQYVSLYLSNFVLMHIEKGDFFSVRKLTRKLYEIMKEHENTQTKIDYYEVRAKFLLKTKRFFEALSQVDIGIHGSKAAGQDLMTVYLLGMKAQIQSMIGKDDSAENSLTAAKELIDRIGFVPPHYSIRYRIAKFIFDLKKLEEAVNYTARINQATFA
jgi:tetratricopeptide (TPR) repeat protein